MNLYNLEDVKKQVTCEDFLTRRGHKVENHRCAATWRGGTGMNVSLEGPTFYDHKTKFGGSVIDLCHCIENSAEGKASGMDVSKCASIIGDLFGLVPKSATRRQEYDYRESSHYKRDIEEGYSEKTKYVYTDSDGRPLHMVIRMEHPSRPKDFIQCTPWSGSLSGVDTVLYNLPAVLASNHVVVVEGEKDADTLNALGICATTCNNGSDHWRDSYTETLRGKSVIVCRDNDQAGLDHAHLVLSSLAGVAAELRLVCPSQLPKGDVTDWMEKEGGSKDKFMRLCAEARALTPEEAKLSNEKLALARAKAANKLPFGNFRRKTIMVRGKEKEVEVPRTINEMMKDLYERFLNFPRRIGDSTIFDHNRDTGKIETFPNSASLFAWIGERSNHPIMWKRGDGMVSKDEFFQAVMRNSMPYEKISEVPSFPIRADVYYTYRDQLKPTKDHAALRRFMSFFNPSDEESAVLMRSMVAAMMYFRPGVQRPCWIIDSPGAQSAGKTTFAEMACYLYKTAPMKTNTTELSRDAKELNKRLVSVTGRKALMLLVDNVKGTFENSYFADLVTCFNISGKAPYGIGEESRPNDLTYVITSNSATVGSDIASRSFFFFIDPPKSRTAAWKRDCMGFVDARRYEILGDILDILTTVKAPDGFVAKTRVPEFEAEVLWKMAGSQEAYDKTIAKVLAARNEANVDEENAVLVVETIKEIIRDGVKMAANEKPEEFICFLRTNLVNKIMGEALHIDVQDIRNMVNTNKIACIRKGVRRYPKSSGNNLRASGILYVGEEVNLSPYLGNVRVHVLGLNKNKNIVDLSANCSQDRMGNPTDGIEDAALTEELRAEADAARRAAPAIEVPSQYTRQAAANGPTSLPPPAPALPPPTATDPQEDPFAGIYGDTADTI